MHLAPHSCSRAHPYAAFSMTMRVRGATISRAAVAVVTVAVSCRAPTDAGSHVSERWYQTQTGESWARPAILGGVAFFGTGDGKVVARRAATGVAQWTAPVGNTPVK